MKHAVTFVSPHRTNRRSNQAVTYQEFRGELCRGVGLGLPEHAVASGGSESASSHKIKSEGGDTSSFCEDGALLQLETSYSLAGAWQRTVWGKTASPVHLSWHVGVRTAAGLH